MTPLRTEIHQWSLSQPEVPVQPGRNRLVFKRPPDRGRPRQNHVNLLDLSQLTTACCGNRTSKLQHVRPLHRPHLHGLPRFLGRTDQSLPFINRQRQWLFAVDMLSGL